MIFSKPKFWDSEQVSFFSIALLPITLLIKFISLSKFFFTRAKKFPIPVICVGNIYLGGTGKTPLCTEIYSILKSLKKKPTFIKKKYKSFQDEINLLKKIGPIYENPKRKKALNNAIEDEFEIAILDDGFQDISIKKDFSIICFNEKQWIGNGFTIPSGPLRENLSALSRANCVVINGKKNTNIEKQILNKNEKIKIFYTEYIPTNVNEFKSKKIICFAGIGNPINFFELLKINEINIIEQISFADHHNYSKKELDGLIKKSKNNNATLLTTEKDYLRINENNRIDINYLKIKVEIKDKDEFIEEIKKII